MHRNCFTILVQLFRDVQVKDFFGENFFLAKDFFRQNFFSVKDFFGQNLFLVKTFSAKFLRAIVFDQRCFQNKKKFVWPKKNHFWANKYFWPKNHFWANKYFWPKNHFLAAKIFGGKKVMAESWILPHF